MFEKLKTKIAAPIVASTMAFGSCVTAFAEETVELPTLAITTEQLAPIATSAVDAIGVCMPIGIALFAILFGVKLVPKIINLFTA